MSWFHYWLLVGMFAALFAAFYCVTWSVLMGIWENYHRYCQKADLQWTGPGRRRGLSPPRRGWILLAALITGWLVVEWWILPG